MLYYLSLYILVNMHVFKDARPGEFIHVVLELTDDGI